MIQNRINEGAFIKDIAAELQVSPKTISRAIKRGSAPIGKPGRPTESKLDPFKGRIDEMLGRNIWNAPQGICSAQAGLASKQSYRAV